MSMSERAAYLKGLADGIKLDESKDIEKLLKATIDTINELALTIDEIDDDLTDVCDQVDAVDEDLADLEDYVYEDLSDDSDEGTAMLFCFIFNDIFGESTMGDMIEFEL